MSEREVNICLISGIAGAVLGGFSLNLSILPALLILLIAARIFLSKGAGKIIGRVLIIAAVTLSYAADVYIIKNGRVIQYSVICFFIAYESIHMILRANKT